MVKSVENGISVPPFLSKCYEMVDDESTDALISWTATNYSFIIWDVAKFSAELLPKYFKHSNFSSFVRQLNIYGFRKTDTDHWEFSNEGFIKDQKHLLKNIIRRKNTQSMVPRKSAQQKDVDIKASEENININLWKEVESLKADKNALAQELVKLRLHQKISQTKLLLLREQLKGMEKNQQQMLSFIVMAMQNPGIFVQLLQPKERNWLLRDAGKNVLKQVTDDCEPIPSERMIVRYQPPADEPPAHIEMPTLDLEDFFTNIDFVSGPLDDQLLSTEVSEPIIIPDLPDGGDMLEQLLLTSPLSENDEENDPDIEDRNENAMELDSTSCGKCNLRR